MRLEITDAGERIFWFRQSWLGEWLLCNDRGRLVIGRPQDTYNEYTATGSALHSGIEAVCQSPDDVTAHQMWEAAVAAFDALDKTYVDSDPAEGRAQAIEWLRFWVSHLVKNEDFLEVYRSDDAMLEHSFQIIVASRDNTSIGWEGQWDALLRNLHMKDWKTSSSRYQTWQYQRWNVQGTVYTEAARQMDLLPSPSEFRLIVCNKNKTHPIDRITIYRDESWTKFLTQQCWRAVDLFDADLEGWPLNDQHALCSEKWCPVWAQCKGLYVPVDFRPREKEAN